MKSILTFIMLMGCTLWYSLAAQSASGWTDVEASQVAPGRTFSEDFSLAKARYLQLDLQNLRSILRDAPMEFSSAARTTPFYLELPMPDGSFQSFEVVNSPIMEEGLAARFPSIQTFAGRAVDGSYTRFDYNAENFTATVMTSGGTAIITQFADDLEDVYISYWIKDVYETNDQHTGHGCELGNSLHDLAAFDHELSHTAQNTRLLDVVDLQTYRHAVATTGEYFNQVGDNITEVLANIVSIDNQVNMVYENEVAIRFLLIDNTDVLFFDDGGTDPYNNGDLPVMITQNQLTVDNAVGNDNYDLGHVYGTNSGGLASLCSACNDTQKARAGSAPFGAFGGSNFFLIVCHEIGHQFCATHIFNNCDGDNETPATGYEPGAGSTIMSYSGASNCGSQWIEPPSDPYFNGANLDQIMDYSRDGNGGSCDVAIEIQNQTPDVTIDYPLGFGIPISTPFKLTASAADSDNDDAQLTFCWEQYDLGPLTPIGQPLGDSPLFRSFPPTENPTRIFPRIENVIGNVIDDNTEILPFYARNLNFRCTVRDNNEEGGGHSIEGPVTFRSVASAGPFLVTVPNDGTEEWTIGDYVEVTWDVANTDSDSVNCQAVNIHLSLDGGFTYPIELCAGSANDGTEFVTVPAGTATTDARIRVEAADNIFFDISNEDFTIVEATEPAFALTSNLCQRPFICLPDVLEITFESSALAGFDGDIALSVASGLPTNAVATFVPETMAAGESSVLTIDFTDVEEEGIYDVIVEAAADGQDVEARFIAFETVFNDFSALQGINPTSAGSPLNPDFEWTAIPHADAYEFQLSETPDFFDLLYTETTSNNSVDPGLLLEPGTQYFWRVRPINECSPHDFAPISAFLTEALVCNEVTSDDTPIIIPGTGLPTVTSTINISESGTIDDLNLLNIQGQHDGFSDIKFILRHEGTSAEFIIPNCFSAGEFDFGFDEEGLASIPCPPNTGDVYQSPGPGSTNDFLGMDVQGDWFLDVEVIEDFSSAPGNFASWTLEYCGLFNTANPFVVVNENTCVNFGGFRTISTNYLVIDDDDNSSSDLVFTLVDMPDGGDLTFDDAPMSIGNTFTMADLENGSVVYQNTDPDIGTDGFSFTVIDGNGGFLNVTDFTLDVIADADCITSTENISSTGNEVTVFPNPASDQFFVSFKNPIVTTIEAELLDIQGRVINTYQFDNSSEQMQFNTANLSAGVYIVRIQTDNQVFARKVTIE